MGFRETFALLGWPSRLALAVAVAACVFGTLACAGFVNIEEDRDLHPTMDAGVRAAVLYPGQAAPPLTTAPWAGAAPGAPVPPGAAPPAGYPPPPGAAPAVPAPPAAPGYPAAAYPPAAGGFTSFGGTQQDVDTSRRVKGSPTWFRYLTWPFALVTYPLRKVGEWVRGDPHAPERAAAGPALPPLTHQAALPGQSREALQAAEEEARLRALEQQLAQQQAGYGSPAAPPIPQPSALAPSLASARPPVRASSIAQELAALRGQHAPAPPSPTAAPRPPDPGPADRVLDRDGDGRPDLWIQHEGERRVREVYDEDGDGRPDRLVSYDERGELALVEEDLNRDGAIDSWTQYQAGVVVRRRADADGDGAPDAWTFYRDGRVARHERDSDADGFRDRVEFFEAGTRTREEQDRDGDGRVDLRTWFDGAGQPTRQEEDRDGDGAVDVRSHYENGRLVRRELLSDAALGAGAPPGSEARAEPWPPRD